MKELTKRFIGDRAFYRRVLAITIPVMVQIGITNFVNLLDNVMVINLSHRNYSMMKLAGLDKLVSLKLKKKERIKI